MPLTNAQKQSRWRERRAAERTAEREAYEAEIARLSQLRNPPAAAELHQVPADLRRSVLAQEARLVSIQRHERTELILTRITQIERHLGLREPPAPPRHSRRRPLGVF